MHFTTAFLASVAAMTASAAPTENLPAYAAPEDQSIQTFGLITIRSGSPIQNSGVQAARSNLVVALPQQNATCDAETNFATFYLKDGELNLYTTSPTPQTIYVDRSGMGQGKIGYTTGAQNPPRNAERKGWAVVDEVLTFDGTSVQACPSSIEGSWSLWLGILENPAGYEGCLSVISRTVSIENPIGCLYT